MIQLRTQVLVRFIIGLTIALCVVLAIYDHGMLTWQIAKRKRSVESAYLYLQNTDPSVLSGDSADAKGIIERITENSLHYLILDESCQVVAADGPKATIDARAEQIRHKTDLFAENAQAEEVTDGFGQQICLRGKLQKGDHLFYVLLYMYTTGVEQHVQAMKYSMGWMTLTVLVLSAVVLFIILSKVSVHGTAIRDMVHRMYEGDLTAHIDEDMPDLSSRETAKELNALSDRLFLNSGAIKNYDYLIKILEKGENDLEGMQRSAVAQITHQLKTPLAIISSQLELDHEETDPSKKEYYYESVMEEIDKLSVMIGEILRNLKGKEIGMTLRLQCTSVSDLLGGLAGKYDSWLYSKNIYFEAEIAEGIVIEADPVQIEQAVHNYMMNAFAHTQPEKHIRLMLCPDGDGCRISVYNEGNGIPEQYMEEIWKPFRQGAPDDVSTGTGLGLYIVKEIARQHKGECGAENKEGGVEFWIFLPARQPQKEISDAKK